MNCEIGNFEGGLDRSKVHQSAVHSKKCLLSCFKEMKTKVLVLRDPV